MSYSLLAKQREIIVKLWDKYDLPEAKRRHVELVCQVALFIAHKLGEKGVKLNIPLLEAAALLHDIDKNIPKLPGERHPDAGVRVLKEEGMAEVAELVRRHPLHVILDPKLGLDTLEAKVLYLSDKMVKYEIIGVDKRFGLWNAEDLPGEAKQILTESYPKVKKLEQEIFHLAGIGPEELVKLTESEYTPDNNP
jgi:hypothetical protein